MAFATSLTDRYGGFGGDADPAETANRSVLRIAAFVVGLYAPLSRFVGGIRFGPISLAFLLIVGLAAIGWWRGTQDPAIRRYLRWGAAFAAIVTISAVIAGGSTPIRSLDASSWSFVLIPGLAVCFSQRDLRRAALYGFIAGSAFYLLIAMSRIASGQSIIDTDNVLAERRSLLGVNRSEVDLPIVWGIAFMFVKEATNIPRLLRIGYVLAAVIWIAASQGRTGAIGLVLAPLLVFALRTNPAANDIENQQQVARRGLLIGLVGILVYVGMTNITIPGFGASERIQSAASGDYSVSDEARVMLLRKAWHLAWEHPLTGVGWGNTPTAFHPVVLESENAQIYITALRAHPHNHYLEVWSDTGTFGALAWIGAMVTILLSGIKRSRNPEIRALTAAYLVVLLVIAFHSAFGSDQFIAMALLLGALADPTNNDVAADLPVAA